jgi:hypothetical protein
MKPKYLPFEWSIDRELAESSASKKPLIEADFG